MTTSADFSTMNKKAFEHIEAFGSKFPEWVETLRHKAKGEFLERGLPTVRNEKWRYTNLKEVGELAYNWSHARGMIKIPEARSHVLEGALPLFFIDGVFDDHLSPLDELEPGLEITSLRQAVEADPERFRPLIDRDDQGVFEHLNKAFLHSGIDIKVRDGVCLERPIQIICLNTNKPQPYCLFPKFVISLGKAARAKVFQNFLGYQDGRYLLSSSLDIEMAAGSHLEHYVVQAESANGFHFQNVKARQGRDSRLEHFALSVGGKLSRVEVSIDFDDEGAECDVRGLYLVDGKRQSDFYLDVNHNHPHCVSNQLYKGLLVDQAKGVFSGIIRVKKDAQFTDARQLNKNLLMSETAQVKSQPQLEIDADNVKCSHGSSIGPMSPKDLFYLRSRGIGLEEAKAMLAKAFVADLVSRIKDESFRRHCSQLVDNFAIGK